MTKCTFCAPRLDAGMEPACVTACPTEALGYGDRDTLPGLATITGFPDTPAGPSIRFVPLREGTGIPEGLGYGEPAPGSRAPAASTTPAVPSIPAYAQRITLRTEWPLALFTLLAATLAASLAAGLLGASRPSPVVFATLAGGAMGLSSLHLGKKARAWRAVLNLRGSWLSREVALFGLFVATGLVALGAMPHTTAALAASAAIGGLLLFSMDRVYDVAAVRSSTRWHSAGVLLTGVHLTGVFAMSAELAVPAAILKLILYGFRRSRWSRTPIRSRPVFSGVRVLVGLVVPAGVIWLGEGPAPGLVAAAALLGELIDRMEFYADFEPESPARVMALAHSA
jgi:DMSO reductase anchor subunit